MLLGVTVQARAGRGVLSTLAAALHDLALTEVGARLELTALEARVSFIVSVLSNFFELYERDFLRFAVEEFYRVQNAIEVRAVEASMIAAQ